MLGQHSHGVLGPRRGTEGHRNAKETTKYGAKQPEEQNNKPHASAGEEAYETAHKIKQQRSECAQMLRQPIGASRHLTHLGVLSSHAS